MKKHLRQEVKDELDALISCVGEGFVTVDECELYVLVKISVALPPRPSRILISAADGQDFRQFETSYLSPVHLHFRLPDDYPAGKAFVDVECSWMPTSMRNKLLSRLDDVLTENAGYAVLFVCCEAVKAFATETEITEIFLGHSEISSKQGLRPIELLNVVREECEQAAVTAFADQCHDCEVCFENKSGRDCVRFSPCEHCFCKDCVGAYFKEKLTSQVVSPLTCLADGCESCAAQAVLIELLGQNEFDRYESILLERAIEGMNDIVPCPKLSCQKPSSLSQVTEKLATCLVCGYNFCASCRRSYHGVEECRKTFTISVSALVENEDGTWRVREVTLEEYLRATQEERIEMGWWYGGIENLEKFEGCNHMTCAICSTEFCWSCDAVLSKKDPYNHFREEVV
ncbi:unnamed protein product [Heligmosomoides polygyrus]|uniref:RBR-type E3 ubiquitin transferase n=1 Tax=Heligmosomoides polygyrus TaxID=6339 RepID=A0A3P8C174_HELPZ|nr:unnamed protein product [Heligmosomoides polygyrus]